VVEKGVDIRRIPISELHAPRNPRLDFFYGILPDHIKGLVEEYDYLGGVAVWWATISVRDGLDEATVDCYCKVFDKLPPITAYEIGGTLVVADGHHTLAAARRLGKEEIEVDVRQGTLSDALEHAAMCNLRHPKNLTQRERCRAIYRLHHLHPEWTQEILAKTIGMSAGAVSETIRVAEAYHETVHQGEEFAQIYSHPVKDIVIAAKIRDTEQLEQLLRLKKINRWSRETLRRAVDVLRDPDVPDDFKQQLLAGNAPGFGPIAPASDDLGASLADIHGAIHALRRKWHSDRVTAYFTDGVIGRTQAREMLQLLAVAISELEMLERAALRGLPLNTTDWDRDWFNDPIAWASLENER
jgi:hypothetical protein